MKRTEVGYVSKLAILLGVVVLAVSFALAPMPLTVELQNPNRSIVIYPNLLLVIPLLLLGALLVLYGATVKKA